MKVVKETSFEQWRDVLSKIYKDNFEDPKVENADQVKMLDVLSKNEKAAEHEVIFFINFFMNITKILGTNKTKRLFIKKIRYNGSN